MIRTFIELPTFSKRWSDLGFSDVELRILQIELLKNPEAGVIMQGTGGVRKVRVAFDKRGKSGSARVCYIDFADAEKIYLLTAYAKQEKGNLSDDEKNNIRKLVKILKSEVSKGVIR